MQNSFEIVDETLTNFPWSKNLPKYFLITADQFFPFLNQMEEIILSSPLDGGNKGSARNPQ